MRSLRPLGRGVNRGVLWSFGVLGVLVAAACASAPTDDPARTKTAPLTAADAGRQRNAWPAFSLNDVLEQTACVLEGDVTDITYSYDEPSGPRTNVALTNLQMLVGACSIETLTLRMIGGPLPNGLILHVSEIAHFAKNSHYVVFLANHDWFYSPVVSDFAYRVETIGARSVLIHTSGSVLLRFSDRGAELSPFRVANAAGSHFDGRNGELNLPQTTPERATADLSSAMTKDDLVRFFVARRAALSSRAFNGDFVATHDGRDWHNASARTLIGTATGSDAGPRPAPDGGVQ